LSRRNELAQKSFFRWSAIADRYIEAMGTRA
jgi:hypothetical protein